MDDRQFAALQRSSSGEASRRSLLGWLAMPPLVGALLDGFTLDAEAGRNRRRRRRRRRRRWACKRCAGCCDSSRVCQPGTANAACGSSGQCSVCTGQEVCQNQACVCVPDCAGRCDGRADGCGGTCTDCAAGLLCLDNGTCAIPCPGGNPDCAAAGCAVNRCVATSQGGVCVSSSNGDTCAAGDNGQCPTGSACAGVTCETVC